MARALTVLLVLLVVVLGLAALVGYLAYGTGPGFEGEAQVSGLAAPVTIGYTDSDVPMIEAQSEADLMTGLGYAHALRSAWPMALLRQAATSSLSGWIEDSTANLLDRHTLRLGFGAFARATYDALSEEERAVLQAYARGVNGAFGRARLNEGDEFVLFDVRADPWQPWHALAVERLVAYLATPPVTTDSTARAALRASASLREFAATDSIFRNTLHLGDLGHALAFTLRDSTGSTFAQRLVYGQTALPLFREVVLRQGGRSSLVASIPGTLMLPAGYGDRAWSVFLSNTATLAPDPDSTAPAPSFARIVTRSGDESLVKTYRRDRALLLYDPEAPPPALRQRRAPQDTSALGADSLRAPVPQRWQLRWQGLGTGTDLGAWRALLRGGTPSFTLMRGTGLLVEGGQARVLGSPAVVRDLPGGVFAGDHPLSVYVADRLALPADSAAFAEAGLLTDAYSTWAAELAPPLTAILGAPDEVADDLREVAAYLRGWDFRYAPSSIAASIFDTWMAAYQRETGTLPDLTIVTAPPPPPDSTGTVPERPVITALEATLRQALDTLRTQHGEIGAAWRWQNVQEATRHYPLFGERASDGSRFASAIRPDGGHPTALAWGPSPAFSGPEATASWSARASAPDWDSVRVRHRDLYDVRYRTRRLIDPVEPYAIARTDTPEPRLRLVPAGD